MLCTLIYAFEIRFILLAMILQFLQSSTRYMLGELFSWKEVISSLPFLYLCIQAENVYCGFENQRLRLHAYFGFRMPEIKCMLGTFMTLQFKDN